MITFGIDISKQKFDYCCKINNKLVRGFFPNELKGFEKLLKLIPKDEHTTLVMEATGNYGFDLASFMYNHGVVVHVINPAQIKYYAKSLLSRAKTDKVDAKIIMEFASLPLMEKKNPWKPLSPNLQALRDYVRCLDNIKKDLTQLKNRCESEKNIAVQKLYKAILGDLSKRMKTLEFDISDLIKNDEVLTKHVGLLTSIQGVGDTTAWSVLAELPDIAQFKNAKEIVAYAGLNPKISDSGKMTNIRRGITKTGSNQLRKCLFLPAMVAIRYNYKVKALSERLSVKGKNKKAIIIAAMHLLLRIIFGILKSGQPFKAAPATV